MEASIARLDIVELTHGRMRDGQFYIWPGVMLDRAFRCKGTVVTILPLLSALQPRVCLSPLFGSEFGLDLGASNQREGNLRVRSMDDRGAAVGPVTRGVVWPGGFRDATDLLEGMARRIRDAWAQCLPRLGDGDTVRSIVAFCPGQANLDSVVSVLANLKDAQGRSLQQVDFSRLPGLLANLGVPVAPGCRVKVANDMVGGICEALHQIARKHPQAFRPGLSLVYMATGGGFGVAMAEYNADGNVRIRSSELGRTLDPGRRTTLEDAASLPGLLAKFTSKLPATVSCRQRKQLRESGQGEIATDYRAAAASIPGLDPEQFRKAVDYAAGQYVEAIARVVSSLVLQGLNLAVLSGPVLNGVEHYVNENPCGFFADLAAFNDAFPGQAERRPFDKLLLNRIYRRLDLTGQSQFRDNGFDVVTDIEVPDNTAGARYLARGEFDGRGDRVVISADALRQS